VVAAILFISGQRLTENPSRFLRDPGVVEAVKLESGLRAAEVSLREGQSHKISGKTNGNHFYCFAWSTEYGPDSVVVSVFLKPWSRDNSTQWRRVAPESLCQKGEHHDVTITSNREQVVQYGWYLRRAWVPVSGQRGELCRGCGDMPTFDEVSNPDTVSARGTSRKVLAATIGTAGILTLIGLSVIFTALYHISGLVFSSQRKQTLHAEMRRRHGVDDTDPNSRSYANEDDVRRTNLGTELERELEELEKTKARLAEMQKKRDD